MIKSSVGQSGIEAPMRKAALSRLQHAGQAEGRAIDASHNRAAPQGRALALDYLSASPTNIAQLPCGTVNYDALFRRSFMIFT
jgi:hypothetical protein